MEKKKGETAYVPKLFMPQQRGAGYFPGGAACRYRRRILALGQRQPVSVCPGADVPPFDHPSPDSERQGRLYRRQGFQPRGGAAEARRFHPPRKPRRGDAPAGAAQTRTGQGTLRERFRGGGDRWRSIVSVAVSSGRFALPARRRRTACAAASRLVAVCGGGGEIAAAVAAHGGGSRRETTCGYPLQGVRAHVRPLRRSVLHSGHERFGHSVQDRLLEHQPARQLFPALRGDASRRGRG